MAVPIKRYVYAGTPFDDTMHALIDSTSSTSQENAVKPNTEYVPKKNVSDITKKFSTPPPQSTEVKPKINIKVNNYFFMFSLPPLRWRHSEISAILSQA